jgi:hypothetical protein
MSIEKEISSYLAITYQVMRGRLGKEKTLAAATRKNK